MTKRLPTITELVIKDIIVPKDRLRVLSEAKVLALMGTIKEFGFSGAIKVRRAKGTNTLIDGLHRLTAASRLDYSMIPSDAFECTQEEARRMEIEANLTAGMTPLQDALFLAEWQRQYEALHPETTRGMAGALAKQGLQASKMTFAELVAETRQILPRQVQKITAAARRLSPHEAQLLQAAKHRLPMTDIEKLGKIADEELRLTVVQALSFGEEKSVRSALKAFQTGVQTPVKDPVEEAFKDLSARWSRAPMAAKKRFLLEHAQAIWEAQNKGVALVNWAEARDE
jgi:ParB family transcriptional regulator, chromosome partitioning protein